MGYTIGMFLEYLQELVMQHTEYAALLLLLAKILGAILFVPGAPLTLLAGALLGTWNGFLVSLIGNILGATCAFLIARYALRNFVQEKLLNKYPKIKAYEDRFFTRGLHTVIFLRLIPLFPFNAINYALGVTRVSTKDYILGTAVGIIPGTFAYTYFGESIAMLSPLNITFAVLAIVGLVYVGKLGKRYEK
jgi:uncharacterized membrane protein YdjX (TVP38/TMEM64 family)